MRALKHFRWLCIPVVIGFSILFIRTVFAADNVPKEVLDLRKSVVRVICFSGEETSTGTGFAIGTQEPISYIVTNFHVIEKNPKDVQILRAKNLFVKASVFVELPYSDLCVLKLDEPLYDTPPAILFDENIAETGQAVFSLGFPGAADYLSDSITGNPEDVTLTDGIISSVKSLTLYEGFQPVKILQINAAVNPGNSGGPLVNKAGQVLGINTYTVIDSQNINAAISILELVDVLKQKGVAYLSNTTISQSEQPNNKMQIPIIIGSILIGAGGITAIILFTIRRRKRTGPKGVTLEAYLKQWGGKLPFEMAIRVLAPVFNQLADLHYIGHSHLDISPAQIIIDSANQAVLLMPSTEKSKCKKVLHPSYSAPEQYREEAKLGAWTDVYSITAVLFLMITGVRPLGVLQRALEADTIADTLRVSGINVEEQAAIESGLALSAAQRHQNVLELMKSLKLEYVPSEARQSQMLPCYSEKKKREPIKISKKVVIKTAAIFFAVAIPTVVIGGWIYIQHHYETTIAYVEEQKYDDAYNELLKMPQIIYKDNKELGLFIVANIEIRYKNFEMARGRFEELGDYRDANEMFKEVDYQEGLYLLDAHDFNKSREIFKSLGEYKDSKTMLLEVDYQESLYYLNQKEFNKAEECFKALAGKKYRDAETQVKEVNYQWAKSYFESEFYEAALSRIKSVDGYKDSTDLRHKMTDSIYNKGIDAYRNSDNFTAKKYFQLVDSYKNSDSYLLLVEAKSTGLYQLSDYQQTKTLFNRLKQIETLEDAKEIMVNDVFIWLMLEGYWKDGSNYISLKHKEKDEWELSNSLPYIDGKYFNLENSSVLFGSVEKGWKRAFDLSFISDYELVLFCAKNNRTYYMTKR